MTVLIATRGNDRLYCTASRVTAEDQRIWEGYILTEDDAKIDVPNIEVLLQHGYWDEIVEDLK